MKKIINDPHNVVAEMVSGMTRSYPQFIEKIPDTEAVVRSDKESMKGKVGIISGGGSGHEPTIKAANQGQGVFMVVKNYSGDIMNFDMAKDLADMDDIPVRSIVVDDDIAVENSLYTQGRRGVAGTLFMHKILGAAAQQGASLDKIEELAKKVLPNIKTIAVALSAATNPEVGKPGFVLKEDEIEYGVGIHSEPGYRREKIKPSKELVEELVGKLNDEMHLEGSKKYACLVNGMGATPLMEQYIFANDVLNKLDEFKIKPSFMKVGNYMTSLDMAGISLTLFEIKDDKWLDYLNFPVKTIAW